MNPFDRDKRDRRNRTHSWINGFETKRNVEKPDYRSKFMLTDAEITAASDKYMRNYNQALNEFKNKTKLTNVDMGLLMIAAVLQTLRWGLLSHDKFRFDKASDSDKFFKKAGERLTDNEFVPASVTELITSHTVPYDAIKRSERFKDIYDDFKPGVSGYNHRYKALGHDPLAGLIVGTANIATNTLTVNDFSTFYPSYHVLDQEINGKTNLVNVMKWTGNLLVSRPEVVGASLIKQVVHCSTDIFTKQGLPIPVINTVSPETSKFLIGNQIDTYSVIRGAGLSVLINKLIEMVHRLFYKRSEDIRLYEVRTRKILLYSNTLSSALNIGYVGLTRDIKRLDIGGLLVTLYRILSDRNTIKEIQREFINNTLDNIYKKEEDEINQRLARWGFQI